jgi:hypothetical protein
MRVKYQIYQTEGVKNGAGRVQRPIRNEEGQPLFETLIENADWLSMELLAVNKFVRTSGGRLIQINNVYLQTGAQDAGDFPGIDSYLVIVGHEVHLEGSTIEDGKMF